MKITNEAFGEADGRAIDRYTLANDSGFRVRIITYGGRVTELHVPDRSGQTADVCLGFDNLKSYVGPNPYFGALIGRVANRMANGKFELDGKHYQVSINNGPNMLHGGKVGWDRRVWKATPLNGADHIGLQLDYVSPDGEEGFPGTITTRVVYSINDRNELRIDYSATTDKPTPINLTNHSYFNLKGAGNGDVLEHDLQLLASHYTPVDDKLIPTGQIAPVEGTPMDFRSPHAIGARIGQTRSGYDYNFALDRVAGSTLAKAARVVEPKSGRTMEVHTTQPGIQFYSGNFLDGSITGLGGKYVKHGALCLETQHFPDAVHHKNFPNTILRPGEQFQQSTVYAFGVLKT